MKKIHKISRWIWFFNGIFILIVALLVIYIMIEELVEDKSSSGHRYEKGPIVGEELEKARMDSLALQDLVVSLPQDIYYSDYDCLLLRSEDLEEPVSYGQSLPAFCSFEPPSYNVRDDLVNILFYRRSDYSDPHLLLSEKANIVLLDIPFMKSDSLQNFILYGIVTEDSNGDGRLNSEDHTDLFLSDLSGNNLRSITDEEVYLVDYAIDIMHEQIVFKTQKKLSGETTGQPRVENILIYNLKQEKISRPLNIQKFVNRARELVWR